jgi:hypothetical protein
LRDAKKSWMAVTSTATTMMKTPPFSLTTRIPQPDSRVTSTAMTAWV